MQAKLYKKRKHPIADEGVEAPDEQKADKTGVAVEKSVHSFFILKDQNRGRQCRKIHGIFLTTNEH